VTLPTAGNRKQKKQSGKVQRAVDRERMRILSLQLTFSLADNYFCSG